ncbi:MAG: GAF domain-containing protein [Synergistaceae bacterium]|jgi:GAF domain-containing protein|nr:GAF domain-containing protein [Synergistaceae bacterium]
MRIEIEKHGSKPDMYRSMCLSLNQLIDERGDTVANLANASALINMYLDDISWVGFYLMKDGGLTLGPFQGKVAVTRIEIGDGVCGTAAAGMRTVRVDDVHTCDNHITCDIASSSEIVVPMIKEGDLVGVLDIDSPLPARFDEEDERGLEDAVSVLIRLCPLR